MIDMCLKRKNDICICSKCIFNAYILSNFIESSGQGKSSMEALETIEKLQEQLVYVLNLSLISRSVSELMLILIDCSISN